MAYRLQKGTKDLKKYRKATLRKWDDQTLMDDAHIVLVCICGTCLDCCSLFADGDTEESVTIWAKEVGH